MLRLSGSLHLSDPENPATRIGLVDSHDLIDNMACRSIPSGNTTTLVDLRFPLTLPLVERLEAARHASPEEEFVAHVHLDGVVAWLRTTHGEAPLPGETIEDTQPGGLWGLGLHSEVSLFWLAKIDPLRLAIDTSSWVRNVLPGLGYDRVRLLEIIFPPPLPPVGNAARQFDAARKALEAKRYSDCLSATRGVISAWNRYLDATKSNPVQDVLGNRLGWEADDPRRALLQGLWKTLTDFANVPHHPEGQRHGQPFDAGPADAELQLMLIAVVSEYLGDLLKLAS